MFKKRTIYTLALALITASLLSYEIYEANHPIVIIRDAANTTTMISLGIEKPAEMPFPPLPPIPMPLPPQALSI